MLNEENMGVFAHLIYEYLKGLRPLALHTFMSADKERITARLERRGITYTLQQVSDTRMNVYFGNPTCVEVVRSFGSKPLCRLTSEEDFILGIMLGYDRQMQCERYLHTKQAWKGKVTA